MPPRTLAHTPLDRDFANLDPDALDDLYEPGGYIALSDEQCFALAARAVAIPKAAGVDSFLLHAPLEIMARRALLTFVAPGRRDAVRRRMLWVAATYARSAQPASAPAEVSFASASAACRHLLAGIDAGDLDGVDSAACWLARFASFDEALGAAGPTLDRLGAAGHAPIYFHLLARHTASSRPALGLLRPLVRELARVPQLRMTWIDAGVTPGSADADALARALATTPRLGRPGSDFVFPIVHQVDRDDRARAVIEPALPRDTGAAGRAVQRVAAWSMVQDDPASAPYGWSHCLTLPQAVLGVRPRLEGRPNSAAIAIAATYVVGFRAALGAGDVDLGFEPEPVTVPPIAALAADPPTAAAAVFHAAGPELDALIPELAARAGAHEDAHLAKYTLACLDAAADDPGYRHHFLAAAAYLHAWWSTPTG